MHAFEPINSYRCRLPLQLLSLLHLNFYPAFTSTVLSLLQLFFFSACQSTILTAAVIFFCLPVYYPYCCCSFTLPVSLLSLLQLFFYSSCQSTILTAAVLLLCRQSSILTAAVLLLRLSVYYPYASFSFTLPVILLSLLQLFFIPPVRLFTLLKLCCRMLCNYHLHCTCASICLYIFILTATVLHSACPYTIQPILT